MASILSKNGIDKFLQDLELDLVSYRFNQRLPQKSLFFIEGLGETSLGEKSPKYAYNFNNVKGAGDKSDYGLTNNLAALTITKIEIGDVSISFEVDKNTKVPNFKSADHDKSVKITFVDNHKYGVRKYIRDWIRCWYNEDSDKLVNGIEGKMRDLTMFGCTVDEDGNLVPYIGIALYGLKPTKLNGFNYEFADEGDGTFTFEFFYSWKEVQDY